MKTSRTDPDNNMQTLLFKNCLGVFQGGGCRGAALAGAYNAAAQCGVHLSKVAGTSAGSLLAALIGAGATPAFVLEALKKVDFLQFLDRATGPKVDRSWRLAGMNLLLDATCQLKWSRVIRRGGMYSSKFIDGWVEGLLEELLPDAPKPVAFASLPKPTFIVAADLLSSAPKIWSTLTTPDESVAFAVRASCSIPVFFQPVESGNSRYVDGGILSNCPTFVFAPDQARGELQEPILAFRLVGNYKHDIQWTLPEFASRLASVVVDGGSKVQEALHRNIHSITIPTQDVQATDFEKIDSNTVAQLVKAGEKATLDFIRTELSSHISEQVSPSFYHQEEIYRAIVKFGRSNLDRVLISQHTTRWFWSLFPTILGWRMQGIPVDVVTDAQEDAVTDEGKRERQRRRLLRGLGVNVVRSKLPFRGYILKDHTAAQSAAILATHDGVGDKPLATFYSGYSDATVIDFASEKLIALVGPPSSDFIPTIEKFLGNFEERLKQAVPHYRNTPANVKVFTNMPVPNLQVLTPLIREFKIRQADNLISTLTAHAFTLFEPLEVILSGNERSVITPPVIEENGGRYFVIEGNTRVFQCWQSGIPEITCALVRDVGLALPRLPFSLSSAQITAHGKNPHMQNLDLFRPIEDSLHPV